MYSVIVGSSIDGVYIRIKSVTFSFQVIFNQENKYYE